MADEAILWDVWDAPYMLKFVTDHVEAERTYSFDDVTTWKQTFHADLDGDRRDGTFKQTPVNEAAKARQAEWEKAHKETS